MSRITGLGAIEDETPEEQRQLGSMEEVKDSGPGYIFVAYEEEEGSEFSCSQCEAEDALEELIAALSRYQAARRKPFDEEDVRRHRRLRELLVSVLEEGVGEEEDQEKRLDGLVRDVPGYVMSGGRSPGRK